MNQQKIEVCIGLTKIALYMQKDQLCFFQLQDFSFWVWLNMGVSGVPPKMDSWSSFFLLKLPYLRVNPQVSDKPIHPINLSFVKSIHMFDGYIPNYCNFGSGEFSDTPQFCSMPRKHALIAVALLLGETPLERLKGHPKMVNYWSNIQMKKVP